MSEHSEAVHGGQEPDGTSNPLLAVTPIFGKKWHPVVLHRLLTRGPLGFNDLADSIEGISHKVLSSCLDDLRSRGLVARQVVSESPYRVAYSLTPSGETLEPVLEAMEAWGSEAVDPVATRSEAVVRVPR